MHLRVELLSTPPESPTIELKPRTPLERARVPFEPTSPRDLFSALALALPSTFPDFEVATEKRDRRAVVIRVAALDADEECQLRQAAATLGFPSINIDSSVPPARSTTPAQNKLTIIVSRSQRAALPAAIRHHGEEDEDFWRDTRDRVFTEPEVGSDELLGHEWRPHTSRCLVTTTFPPRDLRTYLSLYGEVILSPPVGDGVDALAALGVSEEQLAALVATGRVRVILPQSLERYSDRLLGCLGEVSEAPGRVLMSRRLAAAAAVDSRSRLPLLYPAISVEERAAVLGALEQVGEELPLPMRDHARALAKELIRAWGDWESFIHDRGAMGLLSCGVGPLAATIFEQITGRDLHIEFGSASLAVEWALPLRAAVFPAHVSGYSEEGHTSLLAMLLSGVHPRGPGPNITLDVADGLLSIGSGPSALEVATHLGGGDVDRFRNLVLDVANGAGLDGWAEAVERYNSAVLAFESRSKHLGRWDINLPTFSGMIAGGVIGSMLDPSLTGTIGGTVGGYVTQQVFRRLDERKGRHPILGAALDALRGMATRTNPSVVLLARVRRPS
jgi:hypothetical protein